MLSQGSKSESQDSEAYELLSHHANVDVPNGGSSLLPHLPHDDDRPSMHRRTRFSHSGNDDAASGEEVVGLLPNSSFQFPKKIRLSGGLAVALELVTQSTPSLLCAVVGSVMTGVVFDQIQFWPAFARVGELFILVPILLNLKGCLEMNLASRLSTSASTLYWSFLTPGKHWRIRYQANAQIDSYWEPCIVTSAGRPFDHLLLIVDPSNRCSRRAFIIFSWLCR
jgi:hypothetical protein